jgi:hypothetical protein
LQCSVPAQWLARCAAAGTTRRDNKAELKALADDRSTAGPIGYRGKVR